MRRRGLGEHAALESPVHRLEARTKLIGFLTFVVCVSLTPAHALWAFAAYLLMLAVPYAFSRLSLGPVLRRALGFAPFLLTAVLLLPFWGQGDGSLAGELRVAGLRLPVYRAGLLAARGLLLKALLSALAVILAVSTTPLSGLLRGLERLRLPRLLLATLWLLVRYLSLLLGELRRLVRAARGRNLEAGPLPLRLRAAGGLAGSLVVRTFARAERVHAAMLARGYDGTLPVMEDSRLGVADFLFLAAFLPAVIAVCAAALLRHPGA